MSERARRRPAPFRRVGLEALHVVDERAVGGVALYPRLKQVLVRERYAFRVPATRTRSGTDWNRALLLNLGFWGPDGDGADVLDDENIPADVVAHVAWHHLAARALGPAAASADGRLLGESVASAFDLHLVGELLGGRTRSTFLETQVPAMAEVARSAGLRAPAFSSLLADIARDPDRAFGDLRALLFDASCGLLRAHDINHAARLLDGFSAHRFHPLLHHYNLANWILHARAFAAPTTKRRDPRVAAVDRALRRAPSALEWLERSWLRPVEAGYSSR